MIRIFCFYVFIIKLKEVAKVKVINNGLDQNLNGNSFNNTPSQTIFSFGRFSVTSNFDGRKYIDYKNRLSSFVRAVTLDTMGNSEVQSNLIHKQRTEAVLNFDKSNINTFIRFGSAYEFLRISVENIILNYPNSLYISSHLSSNNNTTYYDYVYDVVTNTSTFKIPNNAVVNKYGISYNYGNVGKPYDNVLKNLNLSYNEYVIWTSSNPENNDCGVIGYTGNSSGRNYLMVKCNGNPFSMVTTNSAPIDFHIKPNNYHFENFRLELNQYETYMLSSRYGFDGFSFKLKEPVLLDDGSIVYSDTLLKWSTSDKYNLDIDSSTYRSFLEILLTIGSKYDTIKTDLIARFLTPASIKTYDLTEHGKMTKLLRLYGREFDLVRQFIDSLTTINKISYDKINNVPDQLIKNISNTFGWDYFSLVNENELVESFLTIDKTERNLNEDLMPAEIDIELWRRILINANYFWKSKGTRDAIKSMFLLIGIPEEFINITEYVYTVDGKINPNSVSLTIDQFPTNSLPYDVNGYPIAPLETKDFYFQISGDTDSGQGYMNLFRNVGFDLKRTVDNKKSWCESGSTYRIDYNTPKYYQEDSKLVINTKEVDIALDSARGIESDVYEYIKKDYIVNSSGYTLPYSYVNISLGYVDNENTFPLPINYVSNKVLGDLEVRFNGILLNAPKTGTTTGVTNQSDYTIDEVSKTFTLTNAMYATNNASRRDVIQATFVYSGGTHSLSGITVDYVVTRVNADANGVYISLPTMPRGDVQLTINGIALTKKSDQFTSNQFTGDYFVDSGNTQIVIVNNDVKNYLMQNPQVQVSYLEVNGSNDILARSEVIRIDSFNTNKIYYNSLASRYVYRLNYKSNNASDIKILIDGIALEPNIDYSINTQNQYEVFLPNGLRYGSIISVYYLVGGNSIFKPVVHDIFGVGDISGLSFLEFTELVQKKMINVKNRKTISDFKGGWYPSLLHIYLEYLKRSTLDADNPLLSNGYTFQNLYSFLSKYNSFFQRFIDQLLPTTIILRRSGLMIRNSVFTKQKYMYRRGVNIISHGSNFIDSRNNLMYNYMGDDGSVFLIRQPQDLFVNTVPCVFMSGISGGTNMITGGNYIQNGTYLSSYGIQYRISGTTSGWTEILTHATIQINFYEEYIMNIRGNTVYEYRAFIRCGRFGYTGNTLHVMTPQVMYGYVDTVVGTAGIDSIDNTGGMNIIGGQNVDYYGMQYRKI